MRLVSRAVFAGLADGVRSNLIGEVAAAEIALL
jgi:hypothetical protein